MRRTGLTVLAILLLGGPGPLLAQDADAPAQASVEAYWVGTTIQGSAESMVGGAALLTLGGRLAFGAAGAFMLGSSTVESSGAGTDLALSLAYGGLLLQARLAGTSERYVAFRTLFGAGNAQLDRLDVGAGVAVDNFGVLEPELVGALTLLGPLQIGVGVGYRHVFGVEDLPNLTAQDLRGFSGRIRLSVGTH